MHAVREGNCMAVRLDDGEDLFPSLREALGDTPAAVMISAIGMLRDFELGWLGPDGYVRQMFHEPFELLSISGNVSIKPDGSVFIHSHGSLSGPDYSVSGGHLFRGTVNNTCEIVLMIPEGLTFRRSVIMEGEPPRFCPERS